MEGGAVPDNLETSIFALSQAGTHCQTLGSRGHLVIEGWLILFLRDVPVLPFCHSFIHGIPVCLLNTSLEVGNSAAWGE